MTIATLAVLLTLAGPAEVQGAPEPAPVVVPAAPAPVETPPVPAAVSAADGTADNTEPEGDAIVVTGRAKAPEDPVQQLNLATYEVVDAADRVLVGPIAMGYKQALPGPVRSGLRNFLANLTEPVVFVNYLLQFKPGKAAETAGRFAVNSTVGVAGLIDVAKNKPFHLPRRVNGFANTLGYYGIGPGPYFFLPLIGPTTLRDLGGWVLDKSFLPAVAGPPISDPAFALGTGTVKSLDDRVEFDAQLEEFRETGDAYTAEREYYLAKRKAEIEALHGRGNEEKAAVPAPAP